MPKGNGFFLLHDRDQPAWKMEKTLSCGSLKRPRYFVAGIFQNSAAIISTAAGERLCRP
jgi:hypothetical protein